MNGRASRERTRVASLRGSSDNAYDTEDRSDSGLTGCPKDNSCARFRGEGGVESYLAKKSVISEDEGLGARRW